MSRDSRISGVLILALALMSGPAAFSSAAEPTERPPADPGAQASPPPSGALVIHADQIDYESETELMKARGSVKMVQGATTLVADEATIRLLTGDVSAVGRVHLMQETTDVWADRLDVNFNTEAGLITSGQIFDRDTNALITADKLQRYSEARYRAQNGSFTNCDAMEGQTPAWRFTFEEVDVTFGDSLELRNAWFCVNDVPLIPIPYFKYPVGVSRKTGFLFPSPGYNTSFGFNYRQSFFWAINPSQDLTITPNILTERGFGGDLEYRYIFSRKNRGEWLLNALQDTDQDRARGFVRGAHTMQVTPDLSLRTKANLVSDRTYLQDFSNLGALRALPSADSTLDINQRLPYGRAFFLAQYLQPLQAGGDETFQRLPEVGYRLSGLPVLDSPALMGFDATYDFFWREQGFDLNRVDVVPALTTQPFFPGHAVSLTPSVKPRVIYYSRGVNTTEVVHRETIWSSLRASSRLRRRFRPSKEQTLIHTIEPDVTFEYVPPSDQSDIVQIDNVDNLPKKNLLTYLLRNRLVNVPRGGASNTWIDLTLGQSYHVGTPPPPSPGTAAFGVPSQRFSNVWGRGQFNGTGLLGLPSQTSQMLSVDTFFDPYNTEFSQINTDFRLQYARRWYVEIGQRFARSGPQVERGDIWNPLSFGQTFDPTPEIQFVTASAAVRLPFDITVGSRIYRDFEAKTTPELDFVGLYQNPCRCWSFGLYFQKVPGRTQVNFLVSLRDIGSTDSFGTALLKSLLGPLLEGEKGLPW